MACYNMYTVTILIYTIQTYNVNNNNNVTWYRH